MNIIIIIITRSKLLGEETSRNHQAHRRGHLEQVKQNETYNFYAKHTLLLLKQ